ncbi:MAG: DUF5698 domain-containing protein [Halobacteriota archaeon]|nr:DUF5698 domain-containing protein [Halobacteriota archaeon]
MSFIIGSVGYGLVVLPVLIFLARVLDVSLDTIRIIFISKGFIYFAPIVGFFEIIIWLFSIEQLFQHNGSIIYYVAYAGGFAMGTFVGIYLEDRLSLGIVVIQVVTKREASDLVDILRSSGYIISSVDAESAEGEAKIIYIIIDRRDVEDVISIIKKHNPRAFYSMEDVRSVSERVFRHKESWYKRHHLNVLRFYRKAR